MTRLPLAALAGLAVVAACATAAPMPDEAPLPICEPRADEALSCRDSHDPRQPPPAIKADEVPFGPPADAAGRPAPAGAGSGAMRAATGQDGPAAPHQVPPRVTRRISWRQLQ